MAPTLSRRKTAPYGEMLVASDLSESVLAAAYLLLEKDGLIDSVFYDRKPSLSEFLGWLKLPNSKYLGGFVRMSNVGHQEIAGLGMLWNIHGEPGARRADAHLVFRRKFWGLNVVPDLTSQMIDYSFSTLGIDVLFATTSTKNRALLELTKSIGWTWHGPFPKYGMCHGKPGDAMIGYIQKRQNDARGV